MTTTMRRSSFLSLPGELRNRIYTFALLGNSLNRRKERSSIPFQVSLNPPSNTSVSFVKSTPSTTENWSSFGRAFLGLTQTCRQLRAEFLPIHLAYHLVKVDFADSVAYVQMFIINPTLEAHFMLESKLAVGKVMLTYSFWDSATIRIDDWIRLCHASPTLEVDSIDRAQGKVRPRLDKVLKSALDTKGTWPQYFDKCVTRVEFSVHRHTQHMGIYVKPDCAENSMIPESEEQNNAYWWRERAWWASMGLLSLDHKYGCAPETYVEENLSE